MIKELLVLLVISDVVFGAILSARFAFFLACKWDFAGDNMGWFTIFAFIAGGVLMGFINYAFFLAFGIIGSLACLLATVPIVGLIWVLIVGGNKAIERILSGLLAKIG